VVIWYTFDTHCSGTLVHFRHTLKWYKGTLLTHTVVVLGYTFDAYFNVTQAHLTHAVVVLWSLVVFTVITCVYYSFFLVSGELMFNSCI